MAIKDYTQAIEIDPANAQSFFTRSQLYEEAGERDKALADAKRFMQLAPNNPEALKLVNRAAGAVGSGRTARGAALSMPGPFAGGSSLRFVTKPTPKANPRAPGSA